MNQVFQVSIPIPSYEGDEVFQQTFLFNKSPTREDVVKVIRNMRDEPDSPFYHETNNLIFHLLKSVDQVEEWEILSGTRILTNTHVDVVLKNGKVVSSPFSWECRNVF